MSAYNPPAACAHCATPRSMPCDRAVDPIPDPPAPSCHDTVTMTCPICQHPFTPVGRQKFCSDACRAAAYRDDATPPDRRSPFPKPSPDGRSPSTNATAAAPAPWATRDAPTAPRSCAKSASEAPVQAVASPLPSQTYSSRR